MKGKANLFNVLTFFLAMIVAFADRFNTDIQAWLGIVVLAISAVLGTLFTDGKFVKGWDIGMWIVTVAGIIVQLVNAMGEQVLIPASWATGIVLAINTFINVFYKSYPDTPSDPNNTLAEKKLV